MQKKLDAIKEQVLGRFEVRKTVGQKAAFADWACGYAQALGYETVIERCGKWFDTRNIVIGDLGKARILITAHYDTCARLPFGNMYTPECWPIIVFTQFVLPVILYIALCIWLGFIPGNVLSVVIVLLMLFGPANPHTANDNTSGVAFVLLALHAFREQSEIAFVLFDNEEIGLLGSSAFLKAHTALARRAYVLNMDCVSDGGMLMLAGSRRANVSIQGKKLAKALEEIAPSFGKWHKVGELPRVLYPSDQLLFPRGAAFASLKGKRILYMDRIHSARDTVFDDTNLLCLLEVVVKAFGREKEKKEI